MNKKTEKCKPINRIQVNLKLNVIPIKISERFLNKTYKKKFIKKLKIQEFFFKETVNKIYMEKLTTKNKQDINNMSYRYLTTVKLK